MRIFTYLKTHLILGILLSMFAGFGFGTLIHLDLISFEVIQLKKLILPVTILMIYPMMINFQPKNLLKKGGNKALAISVLINFGIIPFIAFGIGKLFLAQHPLMLAGLLLVTLLPTSGMTISWTGFAKGNISAAVKMSAVGLLLGAILTPIYLLLLVGKNIDIDPIRITQTILITIFVPMLLGTITRLTVVEFHGYENYKEKWLPNFPGVSSLGVIIIIFIAIALKTEALHKNPGLLLQIIFPLLLLYLVNLLISIVFARSFLNRPDAIALVYGTITKNLSIALAIAINSFGSQAALLIAIAYIIQVQVAAGFIKLNKKVI